MNAPEHNLIDLHALRSAGESHGAPGARPGPDESRANAAQDAPLQDEAPPRSRLGAIMLRQGAIDATAIERVADHQRGNEMLFGEAAVALKLVEPHAVARALAEQEYVSIEAVGVSNIAKEVTAFHDPFSQDTESLRALRTRLAIDESRRLAEGRALTIAIVSAQRAEGRSWLAANLAVVFAQSGRRTVLLDADLRNPRQHHLFGESSRDGLASWLSGRSAAPGVRPVAGVRGLDLLTAGSRPPNPQELIGGAAFSRTLGHLSTSASVMLIDTPAASECADYSLVARSADVVLMVVRERLSREREIRDFTARLAEIGKSPLGIVYNRQP
jgi:protein-tyrosine kinase